MMVTVKLLKYVTVPLHSHVWTFLHIEVCKALQKMHIAYYRGTQSVIIPKPRTKNYFHQDQCQIRMSITDDVVKRILGFLSLGLLPSGILY